MTILTFLTIFDILWQFWTIFGQFWQLRQFLTNGKTVLETRHLRHWVQFWRLSSWIQAIILTWQLIVTLDSIRNSCDVLYILRSESQLWQSVAERWWMKTEFCLLLFPISPLCWGSTLSQNKWSWCQMKDDREKISSEKTFVCGNKQSVFSARHNSLLARAHSIFRHCLIDGYWVLQAFLHQYKSRTRHWVHFKFFCSYHWKRKGETFTGNFSRLARLQAGGLLWHF